MIKLFKVVSLNEKIHEDCTQHENKTTTNTQLLELICYIHLTLKCIIQYELQSTVNVSNIALK